MLVLQKALVQSGMKTYYQKVVNCLERKVKKLAADKYSLDLVKDTNKDFSRNRKLDFENLMKSVIFMSGKPIKEELYDYFGYNPSTATASAFVQQRDKLKPAAFESLLKMINKSYPCVKRYRDYRLIAVDGSDLCISYDINDKDTFVFHGDQKGYNIIHVNSAYDLLNHRYVDTIIRESSHLGEQYSMYTMAERFDDKAIFIADRNYSTLNNMEHIIKAKQMFLLRCKDINSNGLLKKFAFPDKEFDTDIDLILTTKQNNEIKANPGKYRFLSTSSTFDFVDSEHPFYPVHYRVVRFKVDGNEEYESIITNLNRNCFPLSEIKKLYNLRWGIEISFRHLKYSADLSALHCRKRNSIQQEIWARLILYNISMIMIEEAVNHSSCKKLKYDYYLNITRCIHIIRNLTKRKGGIPPNLDKLLIKELLPIRPGRLDPRKVKHQSVVCFNYRFS